MTHGDQHGEKLVALEKVLLDQSADPVDLPFSLLKAITGNFSQTQEIGRGGFGVVYKGVLPSGGIIAVKKLFEKFEILDKNFESEVACLVGVKHKNMVRFLGHCSETQNMVMPYDGKLVCAEERQRLLCFEYLPRGCLADYLSVSTDASGRLLWTTHYKIIKGICEGVYFLHQQRIIHMDLKLQNVLLDDNMVPRIADFGLSRRLSGSQSQAITENKLGTMGYMAPEFINNGVITFKTDIYSLGVIVMKILMGHKECFNVKEVIEIWMSKFGTSNSQIAMEEVKVCAEIGIKCMDYDPINRPSALFIIRGILSEEEFSYFSATSGVGTSTEGQVNFISKIFFWIKSVLVDLLNLLVDSTAPSQENDDLNQERKGKAATMSVATGVISTLSGKCTTFMRDEYKKGEEVRRQVSFLEKELRTLNSALEQLELMDEITQEVKNWKDDLREISYATENCIDDLMHQFGSEDVEAGFAGEAAEFHNRPCALHRILNEMQELRNLVVETNARHESYKIDDCKPSSSSMDIGSLLEEVTDLVGIDGPSEEVINWLMNTQKTLKVVSVVATNPTLPVETNLVGIDGPSEEVVNWLLNTQKKLKVVSVVGFGGIGKTTLAKHVFDKISGQFDSVAFFSVSRRPDMRVLLNHLKLKLGMKYSHYHGLDDIIEELRKYLVERRYLIVVDDLWDQSTWSSISRAFPENRNGSRLIVVTRLQDVARVACHNDLGSIYSMKPLNEQNSTMLFFNRVFGSEVVCPPYIKDVMTEILKKCGGLPIAIITLASLLATQVRSIEHWERITKSLRSESDTSPASKEMNSILNLCYKHLPLHLQACFLYFGMYPEDHIIQRDDLVKQWIAEGFVGSLHGLDLEYVGRSYFNELVNRGMIQPSETMYGEVLSCKIHDLMLDLILSKCVEDNFVSVAYNFEDMARLLHGCKYKVRRLSLSSMAVGGATYDTAIAASMSQVRSFMLFKDPIPPLFWFKCVRVLIIIATQKEIVDITAISQLCQLRYLMVKVGFHGKIELPTELGELVYLETLDMGKCELMKSISSDIVHLPRLSYLVLPDYTDLPEGIGNMKSLRTLHGFDLKKSSHKCIVDLSELTNLRELSMKTYYDLDTSKVNALACSIGNLRNLNCFCISGLHFEHENNQHLGSLPNPFQHVERLDLEGWQFRRVPKWMGGLHCLCFLELKVAETFIEDVDLLGELPSLLHLDFRAGKIPDERAILGRGQFPVLEYFHLRSWKDTTAYLGFVAGAMPNLQTLLLDAYHWGGTVPVGMVHLLHLQEIRVYGPSSVRSAFKEASLVHPNRPSVNEGM